MQKSGSRLTDNKELMEFLGVIIASTLVLMGTWVYKKYHPTGPSPSPPSCIGMRLEDFLDRIETTCKVDKGAFIWVRSDGEDLIVERIEEK